MEQSKNILLKYREDQEAVEKLQEEIQKKRERLEGRQEEFERLSDGVEAIKREIDTFNNVRFSISLTIWKFKFYSFNHFFLFHVKIIFLITFNSNSFWFNLI